MQNLPALPERRSPKAVVHEWHRDAARMEVAVALVLVLSICALLLAITRDGLIASSAFIAVA